MPNRLQQLWDGALRTLRDEGPFGFARRILLWVGGERRNYVRPVPVTTIQHVLDATRVQPRQLLVAQATVPFAPVVSIVIPVFNAFEFAKRCVDSLLSAKTNLAFEIVLVDNGSGADVRSWMDALSSRSKALTILRISDNIGYGAGMNAGVRLARSEFLVLANSDTEFTDYSLDCLIKALQDHSDIGVLSPLTNYVGEGPQVAEGAAGLTADDAQAYAMKIRDQDALIEVPERIAFFCVVMRRALFHAVNGFDESFVVGNFEDENLCSRIRLLGLKIAIATNAFVFHHGSKTFEHNSINHGQWMTMNSSTYQNRLAEFATDPSMRAIRRASLGPLSLTARPAPKFSVLVRTRNRPAKLRLALASLAMQQCDCFETIVVNDAGEDVADVLAEFEPFFPIQYVHHETPQTPSGASNSALCTMRGDYFIHLDDDDIVFPFHLELFEAATRKDPGARVLYSGYSRVLMEDDGDVLVPAQRIGVPFWPFDRESLLYSNFIVVHASMFHREVHDRLGLYDPELFVLQDWDYLIRASKEYVFEAIPRVTCEYRFYRSMSNNLINRRERTLTELELVYAKHPSVVSRTLNERQKTVRSYRAQIQMIQQLRQDVERGRISEREMASKVLHELVGFDMSAP